VNNSKKSVRATGEKMANGLVNERSSALSVSLFCSRKKQGCSISEAAKRKASTAIRGKSGENHDRWIEVKLKSTTIVRMKTTAWWKARVSGTRCDVSLPSRTAVLESSAITRRQGRIERSSHGERVANRPRIQPFARVAARRTYDSPCRAHQDRAARNISNEQRLRTTSSPPLFQARSSASSRTTGGSWSSARHGDRWRNPARKRCVTRDDGAQQGPPLEESSARAAGSGLPCNRAKSRGLFRRSCIGPSWRCDPKNGRRQFPPLTSDRSGSSRCLRRTRELRRNSQKRVLPEPVPSGETLRTHRGDFRDTRASRVRPAKPFVAFSKRSPVGAKTVGVTDVLGDCTDHS